MAEFLNNEKEVWVRDCYACADANFRISIRVINENPWSNLFASNMFIRPIEDELDSFKARMAYHSCTLI
jgi:phosphoenolpyruvate carboxykinase (ATP)